ncbi:MAG: gliding motility protein GldN [Saprospiraceae bacterium]
MKFALTIFSLILCLGALSAQIPGQIMGVESDDPVTPTNNGPVIDGVVEKSTIAEKRVLPYEHIRESDIFYEKRVWRVIDIREKINLPFSYPERPFFTILQEAAEKGDITVYSTLDDKFTTPLTPEEVGQMGASVDTVVTFDPVTYEEKTEVVVNELNPADIKRYRIKEDWVFDEESSTLKVRILGIAPLKDEYDENGNYLYELPMFWVYYPNAREALARESAFAFGNQAANRTWEDVMEMRFFSSYIIKESNVFDRRVQDYVTGYDALMEADKIKQEIFNFEHDLWEY